MKKMSWNEIHWMRVLTIVSIFYEDRRGEGAYTGKVRGPYHKVRDADILLSFGGLGLSKDERQQYQNWDKKNKQRQKFCDYVMSIYDVDATLGQDGASVIVRGKGNGI